MVGTFTGPNAMRDVRAQWAKESAERRKAIRDGGPLAAEPYTEEVEAFFLARAREGDGAFATAYATMALVRMFDGDEADDKISLLDSLDALQIAIERGPR